MRASASQDGKEGAWVSTELPWVDSSDGEQDVMSGKVLALLEVSLGFYDQEELLCSDQREMWAQW